MSQVSLDKNFTQCFTDLCVENEAKVKIAIDKLIGHLTKLSDQQKTDSNNFEEKLKYTVRRLISGLCSEREIAVNGFYAALNALLQLSNESSITDNSKLKENLLSQDYSKLIRNKLGDVGKISASANIKGEQRRSIHGYLLAVTALVPYVDIDLAAFPAVASAFISGKFNCEKEIRTFQSACYEVLLKHPEMLKNLQEFVQPQLCRVIEANLFSLNDITSTLLLCYIKMNNTELYSQIVKSSGKKKTIGAVLNDFKSLRRLLSKANVPSQAAKGNFHPLLKVATKLYHVNSPLALKFLSSKSSTNSKNASNSGTEDSSLQFPFCCLWLETVATKEEVDSFFSSNVLDILSDLDANTKQNTTFLSSVSKWSSKCKLSVLKHSIVALLKNTAIMKGHIFVHCLPFFVRIFETVSSEKKSRLLETICGLLSDSLNDSKATVASSCYILLVSRLLKCNLTDDDLLAVIDPVIKITCSPNSRSELRKSSAPALKAICVAVFASQKGCVQLTESLKMQLGQITKDQLSDLDEVSKTVFKKFIKLNKINSSQKIFDSEIFGFTISLVCVLLGIERETPHKELIGVLDDLITCNECQQSDQSETSTGVSYQRWQQVAIDAFILLNSIPGTSFRNFIFAQFKKLTASFEIEDVQFLLDVAKSENLVDAFEKNEEIEDEQDEEDSEDDESGESDDESDEDDNEEDVMNKLSAESLEALKPFMANSDNEQEDGDIIVDLFESGVSSKWETKLKDFDERTEKAFSALQTPAKLKKEKLQRKKLAEDTQRAVLEMISIYIKSAESLPKKSVQLIIDFLLELSKRTSCKSVTGISSRLVTILYDLLGSKSSLMKCHSKDVRANKIEVLFPKIIEFIFAVSSPETNAKHPVAVLKTLNDSIDEENGIVVSLLKDVFVSKLESTHEVICRKMLHSFALTDQKLFWRIFGSFKKSDFKSFVHPRTFFHLISTITPFLKFVHVDSRKSVNDLFMVLLKRINEPKFVNHQNLPRTVLSSCIVFYKSAPDVLSSAKEKLAPLLNELFVCETFKDDQSIRRLVHEVAVAIGKEESLDGWEEYLEEQKKMRMERKEMKTQQRILKRKKKMEKDEENAKKAKEQLEAKRRERKKLKKINAKKENISKVVEKSTEGKALKTEKKSSKHNTESQDAEKTSHKEIVPKKLKHKLKSVENEPETDVQGVETADKKVMKRKQRNSEFIGKSNDREQENDAKPSKNRRKSTI